MKSQRQSPGEQSLALAKPDLPAGIYLLRLTIDGLPAAAELLMKQY